MSILPTNCHDCGSELKWSKSGVDLYCYNKNCSAQVMRKLLHFFQTLNNLDGFGPKTIERLIEYGYDTIPKIYSMKYEHFQDAGYQHQTIMNLGTELEESKERPIEPYRFIAALGINHLGIGSSKKVLNAYEFHDILKLDYNHFISIDGFGDITSREIPEEINERYEELNDIFELSFTVREDKIEVKESIITGKRICFTGKSIVPRKEMQEQAESLGAISVGSVNSKTDILVCGGKVGKNKTDAAKKFGTIVYSEQEYYDLLEY